MMKNKSTITYNQNFIHKQLTDYQHTLTKPIRIEIKQSKMNYANIRPELLIGLSSACRLQQNTIESKKQL